MTHNSGFAIESPSSNPKPVQNKNSNEIGAVDHNPLLELIKRKKLSISKSNLLGLGKDLAAIIGKQGGYSYSYMHSVATGNMQASARLLEAVELMNKKMNGSDVVMIASETFIIQAPPGWNGEGAYCPIEARICCDPKKKNCINHFIPNIHNRHACYSCVPIGKG